MSRAEDVSVLIAGAGCAGLSLAVSLLDAGYRGRILLCEPRVTYTRDRTWCLWDTMPHPFTDCISHRWSAWRVSTGLGSTVQRSSRYSYTHIAADSFYAAACSRLAAASNCEFWMGCEVLSTEEQVVTEDGVVEVQTSQGQVRTKWFFDSRPADLDSGEGTGLLQRFVGWHVRTERPCFNPHVVGLMDFTPSRVEGRTPFLYTLPFSATEALIEQTYLDAPGLKPATAVVDLADSIAEITGGAAYDVLYTEAGCLPMTSSAPNRVGIMGSESERQCRRIGVRGGRAKPSSGYAFLRIQRDSHSLAAALVRGAPLPASPEANVYPMLDRMFLRVLDREPGRAPEIFLRMFQSVPPDRLVRFLSEQASLPEVARVAFSLPRLPFLRAALPLGRVFA